MPNAAETQKSLPTARGPAAKLFAFGFDAWLLTAYLEHLALAEDGSVPGATGVLRIGPEGNVLRTPLWSTFSNGYVVSLGSGG
jgi:outer membrane PBP1 activator LpoA protein